LIEFMPHRHVTMATGSGTVGHQTTAKDQTMRDLLGDWRRWTRTDRVVGLVTLVGALAVASLPYLFAI
jgi:hypothetical protein